MKFVNLVLICIAPLSSIEAKTITLSQTAQQDLAISLYQHDLALIKDVRALGKLTSRDLVKVEGVSQQMQVQSLQIQGAGNISSQSLNRQTISYTGLIRSHIGREITVAKSTASGTEIKAQVKLLGVDQNSVLIENQGAIETIPLHSDQWRLIFPKSEQPLSLAPSLTFISQGKNSTDDIQLNYLTNGLHWEMDYVLQLNQKRDTLQLKGLASLFNNTSTLFKNARINLIAGDVSVPTNKMTAKLTRSMMQESRQALPSTANIGDLKQYPLGGRITLSPQQQTQIPLIQAADIPVTASYRHRAYISSRINSSVPKNNADRYLSFKNTVSNGLGIPLPRGQARVFNSDLNNEYQFTGASNLPNSSANQLIELSTGKAFDLSITQRQTSHSEAFDGSIIGTQFIINNSAKHAKRLRLNVQFNQQWEIISSTYPVKNVHAANAIWLLEIGANNSLVFSLKTRLRHQK